MTRTQKIVEKSTRSASPRTTSRSEMDNVASVNYSQYSQEPSNTIQAYGPHKSHIVQAYRVGVGDNEPRCFCLVYCILGLAICAEGTFDCAGVEWQVVACVGKTQVGG